MTRKAAREAKKLQNSLPTPVGRAVTKEDIYAKMARTPEEWFSMRDICEMMGRHVTPTMRKHVAELVRDLYLEKDHQEMLNHTWKYVYRVDQRKLWEMSF